MKRAVAFIDVLGFKQMVDNHSASELGTKYKYVIRDALQKYRVNADFSMEPSFFPEMSLNGDYCVSYVFSDSIILASHDGTEENCLKLLIFAYRLTTSFMCHGYMVRGGVAFDDMYIDLEDSVFVGPALTKAYELEMNQEWAGVTIHENLVDGFPNIFNGSLKYGQYLKCLLVKYPVPMKKGNVEHYYTINWRWNLTIEKGTKYLFGEPNNWEAKVKVDNTLAYARFIRKKQMAYPEDEHACPLEIRGQIVADGPPRYPGPDHGDEY